MEDFELDEERRLWKPSRRSFFFGLGAALIAPMLPQVVVAAGDPWPRMLYWRGMDGNWSDPKDWALISPNGPAVDSAPGSLDTAMVLSGTVNIDKPITVGTLNIGNNGLVRHGGWGIRA